MVEQAPIAVALSGGVDSATAAALLVEQGRRVIGVTMRLFDATGTAVATGRCCGPRDIEDARRVCRHLDIPFYVVDFESDFARDVVDDFVSTYLRGETPNPCARCNQHIKFTPLLRWAHAMGAPLLATGHYARLDATGDRVLLRRGVDATKDQSYFLFSMPIEQLEAVRFPLGGMTKEAAREKARQAGLPVADKEESQEICFVPDGDYAGFVAKAAAGSGQAVPPPGNITDASGNILGQHPGIHHYTVGQRRGLGQARSDGQPLYVLRVDGRDNQVVVGAKDDLGRRELKVRGTTWFVDKPTQPLSTTVQVRHRARPVEATVTARGQQAQVRFAEPVVASPGQAAVFYRGDTVLGGGWISSDVGGE